MMFSQTRNSVFVASLMCRGETVMMVNFDQINRKHAFAIIISPIIKTKTIYFFCWIIPMFHCDFNMMFSQTQNSVFVVSLMCRGETAMMANFDQINRKHAFAIILFQRNKTKTIYFFRWIIQMFHYDYNMMLSQTQNSVIIGIVNSLWRDCSQGEFRPNK